MPCEIVLLIVLSGFGLTSQHSSGSQPNKARSGAAPEIYEDDEVKIGIPQGWRLALVVNDSSYQGVTNRQTVNKSSVAHPREVVLQNDFYSLTLAFDASHAGPGRFVEAFRIPWLGIMQAWSCSNFFSRIPQPANQKLLFMNLVLRTGGEDLDKACGIKKGFGQSIDAGTHSYLGSDRWFAGVFTPDDGYFFDSAGKSCAVKSYTLTTNATVPEQLPPLEDPRLHVTISEAIAIVNSIKYKLCAPR